MIPAKHTSLTLGLAALAAALGSVPAMAAETRIGNTALARNMVSRLGAGTVPIQTGDDVFQNERVKTGADSAAKFVFSDSTNLAIGASSTVTLDTFVYKGDTSYAKAAVNFAAGTFRFTTGGSDKGAYQLKTGTATIGVRGTQFDLTVRAGKTTITLIQGEIAVCPRARFDGDPRRLSKAQLKRYGCIDMTPGQTSQVTRTTASLGGAPSTFASACGSDGLCAVTVASDTTPPSGAAPTRTALDPSDPALCYVNND